MENKRGINTLRRPATDPNYRKIIAAESMSIAEDESPEVARENIVKDMMRIFDGLLGCTSKRAGVNLAMIKTTKKEAIKADKVKPESDTQRKLEKEIYRLIKRLIETDSPNTGFAVNILFNNGTYYYNKANVPLSFGTFLSSLITFLEGHDCLCICPDEMMKLKTLVSRG